MKKIFVVMEHQRDYASEIKKAFLSEEKAENYCVQLWRTAYFGVSYEVATVDLDEQKPNILCEAK